MKDFKKLIVWQRSMEMVSKVTAVTNALPSEERYTYRDQMIRSSISVPSNIAEGSGRDSARDYHRFLRIALGSSFELETQLLLLEQNNILPPDKLYEALKLNEEVQKMLQSLMKKVKGSKGHNL